MILVDANLLIFASNSYFPQHEPAREWIDRQLSGPVRVGIPWASVMAYLRIVTNPRVMTRAIGMADAWAQVLGWLASDVVWTPEPTEHHTATFAKLIQETTVTANLVSDAHLAALAIEHGLTLCSTDGDLARFRGLRWQNPIA
ncbi:MAG: PIN domain-containing protein [Candidatus Hydrogenedentes bacterium]|nr:PIN domain-containing protein [Candidatus Hydrogenedentota bacterium]